MSATFLASAGRIIWRMAEGHDVDPTALFNQAGLDPNRINQPRARYSVAKVCRAFEHLAELTPVPAPRPRSRPLLSGYRPACSRRGISCQP